MDVNYTEPMNGVIVPREDFLIFVTDADANGYKIVKINDFMVSEK